MLIEFIFAAGIFGLASAGMGLGLLLRRGPPQTSCGAADCLPQGRCHDCPLRKARSGEARQ